MHSYVQGKSEKISTNNGYYSEVAVKWIFTLDFIVIGLPMVAQTVKNLPAVEKTWVWLLGQEDPLEKGMTTHSSITAWEVPWTEEPGRLQPMGLQRVRVLKRNTKNVFIVNMKYDDSIPLFRGGSYSSERSNWLVSGFIANKMVEKASPRPVLFKQTNIILIYIKDTW